MREEALCLHEEGREQGDRGRAADLRAGKGSSSRHLRELGLGGHNTEICRG